jgi:hypothetical protein
MNDRLIHHSFIAIIISDESVQCQNSTTIADNSPAHYSEHLA